MSVPVMVMATNGGPHPPEKWANVSANIIFPLADVAPERIVQARKVQLAIMEELIGHHTRRQAAEKDKLQQHGDNQLDAENDATAEATAAYVAIKALVKGTPWEAHFDDARVRDEVIAAIAVHMQTASHIERQWHCHRNPSPTATAWLTQHHPR